MAGDTTFHDLWQTAGLASLAGHDPRRTFRPAERSGPLTSLPVLVSADPGLSDLELGVEIGRGGQGAVHVAHQASLVREVAVKRISATSSSAARAGLIREARVVGSLQHPNIVPIYALGVDEEGLPMLVMKRVIGASWGSVLDDAAHPRWEGVDDRIAASGEVLLAVCAAVHHAHEQGVLHLDIKPDNVMLGAWGEVYLTDWGLALHQTDRRPAQPLGTPAYLAPELLDPAGVLSPTTDVYLLGATLVHVLTGRPRHAGASLEEVLERAYDNRPVEWPPDVDPDLRTLAEAACATVPSDRPTSARAFGDVLQRTLRNRAPQQLVREVRASIGALRAEVARGASPGIHQIEATVSRGQMTCHHALRVAPGLPLAVQTLADTLVFGAEIQLTAGEAGAAAALLADLAPSDPRHALLAARLDELRAEQARAHALAVTSDPRVGVEQRNRFTLFIVVLLVTVAVTFGALVLDGALPRTPLTSSYVALTCAALLMIGLYRYRDVFRSSRVNLATGGAVVTATVGVVFNRVTAAYDGTSLARMLATDLMLLSAATACTMFAIQPRLAWLSLPYLVGATLIIVAQEPWSLALFVLSLQVSFGLSALLLRRTLGQPRTP